EFVLARHRAIAGFPVFVQSAYVTHEGCDTGDGGEKKMMGAATFQIQSKTALGDLAAEHGVADFEFVEMRSKCAPRNEFYEKLETFFVRGGDNRIGALDALAFMLQAEGGVLSGLKSKRAAGINANQPQI